MASSKNKEKWSHQKAYGATANFDFIETVAEDYHAPKVQNQKKYWIIMGVAVVILVTILGLGFGLSGSSTSSADMKTETEVETMTTTTEVITENLKETTTMEISSSSSNRNSVLGNFTKAAVAADGGEKCAQIGRNVLEEMNGTAVDAAIATLFCNGLISSHSMGIGGGFLMTIYERSKNKVSTIDAREAAPAAATEDMFHGDADLSSKGPLAVAVPGEIKGYYKAKELFGNPSVSWESLIRPSINLAREGIPVTFSKANAIEDSKDSIYEDPGMRQIYINPETNDTWKEGDTYKRLNFANTLERIAKLGFQEFYEGQTAENLVKDLQNLGGIITMEDLQNYEARVSDPISVVLNNGQTLYSIPPPGSGIILGFILNVMENYKVEPKDFNSPLMYHRLIESFKYGYAYRSQIGDPGDKNITRVVSEIVEKLTSEDTAYETFLKINDTQTSNDPKYYGGNFQAPAIHGTSHTSVLAPNGDAVAVTSTINGYFGAQVMSPSTGIIYNNEMDDFSSPNVTNIFGLPPSERNFIRPGKRPQSSMCPMVLLDSNGDVRLVAGAAGGTKITTAVSFATLHNLWLKDDIKTSIDSYRLHHQLEPMRVDYEKGFQQAVIDGLSNRGHVVNELDVAGSVVSAISRENGRVYANSDVRKAGGVDGF